MVIYGSVKIHPTYKSSTPQAPVAITTMTTTDAAIRELIAYIQRVYTCSMRENGQWVATDVLHGRSSSKQVLLFSSPRRQQLLKITTAANGDTLLQFSFVPRWSESAGQAVLAKKTTKATISPSGALRVQGNATSPTPDLVRALVNSGLLLDE